MTLKEIIRESAKNIIKAINPGKADISKIGDGTIKGAISEVNSNTLNIQYGQVLIKGLKANQWNKVTATFAKPYTGIPTVVASQKYSTRQGTYEVVCDTTSKDVTLGVFGSGSHKEDLVDVYLTWIAVGK